MDDKAKLKLYKKVLEDIRDHLECEEWGHDKKPLTCYRCIANQALQGIRDPWGLCAEADAPFNVDEMPVGHYYALISGYDDRHGVCFELATTDVKINLKETYRPFPKEKCIHACSKQTPDIKDGKGNSAGRIIKIEIEETGGYKIIKVIR